MHGDRDLAPRRSRLPAAAFRCGVRQPVHRAAHGAHPAPVPEAPGDLTSDREALARVVAPKLAPFVRESALTRLAADDRLLLEPALLYVTYHRYVPQLDAHIERQADKSGEPLGVPF